MTTNAESISRLTRDLSNEEILKILDHHRDQNFRQAHRERSAHLVRLGVACRRALKGLTLAIQNRIAALALRTGSLG